MCRSGHVKRGSNQPRAHSLNRDQHAARFFNALRVVLAGEIRRLKETKASGDEREEVSSRVGLCEAICLGHGNLPRSTRMMSAGADGQSVAIDSWAKIGT
jgi:hypothetical protein